MSQRPFDSSPSDEGWRGVLEVLDRTAAVEESTAAEGQQRRYLWGISSYPRLTIDLWEERLTKNGRWGHKRRILPEVLLDGLPPPSLEADRRAMALLTAELEILDGARARYTQDLSQATARRIVAALAGHPLVFVPRTLRGAREDGIPLTIEEDRIALSATEEPDGEIRVEVVLANSKRPRPDLAEQCTRRIPGNIIVELDEEAGFCRAIHVPDSARRVLSSLRGRLVPFPAEARLEVLGRLPKLERHLPVLRDSALSGARITAAPEPILRFAPLPGSSWVRVSVLVRPAPCLAACPPGQGPRSQFGVAEGGALVWTERDPAAEKAAAEALLETLPPLAAMADHDSFTLDLEGDTALDLIGLLESRDDVVCEWMHGAWRPRVRHRGPHDLRLAVRDHRDWFGVSGGIDFGETQLHLAALLEAVRHDRRHVRIRGDEWLALGEALRAQLRRIEDVSLDDPKDVKLGPAAPLVLADLSEHIGALEGSERWRRAVARLEARETPEPEGLSGALWPYQLDGFRWLSRLAELGLGACLADDMGLGKTIQAIAMLAVRASLGPALVVAPTSIAFNWRRELQQFAPALKPVVLREVRPEKREAVLSKLGPSDVLIMSYELVMREVEGLLPLTFATLVLDEAQALKNADTDRARALARLDARWRVALTGTPVENHAGELWSLFHVLSPGLLGTWSQFRRRFLFSPEHAGPPDRRRALARVIRPFVLRRTKEEVARDLPSKTESIFEVLPSRAERRRYDESRLAALAELSKTVETEPEQQRRFMVLAAITRLRQLASDVRLVDADWPTPSTKIETAVALLRELRAEGHRALVFSQFTGLLDLLEHALAGAGITRLRLDGDTPFAERARRVEAFQGGAVSVFLLSLKAGGTGLNLTAANYVLHLDPWWNPAAEDQATDRAHRIGQRQPVTVYRLITKGTIEEQILAIHAEKREAVRQLLEGTDTAARLATDELLALIRGATSPETWDSWD